jgi:hypothetical protein
VVVVVVVGNTKARSEGISVFTVFIF